MLFTSVDYAWYRAKKALLGFGFIWERVVVDAARGFFQEMLLRRILTTEFKLIASDLNGI